MTEESSWYQGLSDRAVSEADYIVREFRGKGIEIGGVPDITAGEVANTEGSAEYPKGVGFMYAEGQFLAREQYIRQIRIVVSGHGATVVVKKRVIGDIVLLKLAPLALEHKDTSESDEVSANSDERSAEDDAGTRDCGGVEARLPPVLEILDEIDEKLGLGIATPDQLVTVAGELTPCPATEPQEVYGPVAPYPAVCPGDGGTGVRIFIADTGMLPGSAAAHAWLNGVLGDDDKRTEPDGTLMHYAGHGTFVAGVVRCMAPKAEIYVANIFDTAGSALESHFVPKLNKAFDFSCEILHLTIASPTRKNRPLMALDAWLELLRPYKGVVCVVAAGNNGNRRPCWPAALPGVISVGALATDWRSLAYFSNYGGWVDVYAPGQNLVNAFGMGEYTCKIAPYKGEHRKFCGMAQWSGTSFSTPIVSGLIAARMSRCGENGQQAAAALLAEARAQVIPGVGPVLLPGCDSGCGEPGCGRGCGGGGGCGCGCGCGEPGLTRPGCGCGRNHG